MEERDGGELGVGRGRVRERVEHNLDGVGGAAHSLALGVDGDAKESLESARAELGTVGVASEHGDEHVRALLVAERLAGGGAACEVGHDAHRLVNDGVVLGDGDLAADVRDETGGGEVIAIGGQLGEATKGAEALEERVAIVGVERLEEERRDDRVQIGNSALDVVGGGEIGDAERAETNANDVVVGGAELTKKRGEGATTHEEIDIGRMSGEVGEERERSDLRSAQWRIGRWERGNGRGSVGIVSESVETSEFKETRRTNAIAIAEIEVRHSDALARLDHTIDLFGETTKFQCFNRCIVIIIVDVVVIG